MWLRTLQLSDLRCFTCASITLQPGLNVFLGPNGAGKTSILEAAHLLSYGRSFRPGSRDALSRRGAVGAVVFSEIVDSRGDARRVGIERRSGAYWGRMDGAAIERLSDLFAACAVCTFEPGSHELICGSAEGRRRFLDWSLFHVEPEFLPTWRRYQRALKQRNAGLRAQTPASLLTPWDLELEHHGQLLDRWRRQHLTQVETAARDLTRRFAPELGELTLVYDPGWDADANVGLAVQLKQNWSRDLQRLSTSLGPHRYDWSPQFVKAPKREHLSRGQEKLTALAVILSQATVINSIRGEPPILCVDDLPSELDYAHQEALLDYLDQVPGQVLITGTELTPPLFARKHRISLFHVEQGNIRAAAA